MTALLKTPPKEPLAAEPVTATASDYRALLVRARREQLILTRDNLQRLAGTYDRAAQSIVEAVAKLPDEARQGAPWAQARFNLLLEIDAELEKFRTDYAGLLDLSMLSTAQQAADREAQTAKLVQAAEDRNLFPTLSRTVSLSTGLDVTAQFGVLARSAVEGVANRYYRDGLKLSDRLYNLNAGTRKAVEDTIVQGLTEGTAARDLASKLQKVMGEAGVDTPRYRAERISRTEISNSHREATVRGTIDPNTGGLKSYITGVRWNLSLSHPAADICDIFAAGSSDGLDSGVYLPGEVPVDHPSGLCYLTSEVTAYPGIGGTGKAPDVASVPPSQVAYYARQGDRQAMAVLAAGGQE
jgi:hypothetical protein